MMPLYHSCSVNEEWFLSIGASIGYWQGDVTKLLDDVRLLSRHGPLDPLCLSQRGSKANRTPFVLYHWDASASDGGIMTTPCQAMSARRIWHTTWGGCRIGSRAAVIHFLDCVYRSVRSSPRCSSECRASSTASTRGLWAW